MDDLADAIFFIMKNCRADDLGEFINIGTGVDCTIRELAGFVKDVVSYDGDIVCDESKPDGTPQKLLDVSRLNKLGWKYNYSIEDGIEKDYKLYI